MIDDLLIYTDLNDTLLDRNYSFSAAEEALDRIRESGIPLIICTSKTRAQTEIYRERLGINYPLIVENGGAVHFPPGSFPADKLPEEWLEESGEHVWRLSKRLDEVLPKLISAADKTGARIRTIFDLEIREIMEITGMSAEESEFAKQREHTVYFLCENNREKLFAELRKRGLSATWGSYFNHAGSDNSKGMALSRLTAFYFSVFDEVYIAASFGDNMNDVSMLNHAHYPFLVEKPGGGYTEGIEMEGLRKMLGIGPVGWNRGVLELLGLIQGDK